MLLWGIENDFNAVISASKIKARHALSFADCFTVATAQRENAVVLTGDPGVKNVEKFVEIDCFVAEDISMEMKMSVEKAKQRALELMYRGYH